MCANDGSLPTSRRDRLVASLEALLSNDSIDLDHFRPGTAWCHIAEFAAKQKHQNLQPSRAATHAGPAVSDQNSTGASITPQEPCDGDMILDAVLQADLSLGDAFNLDATPGWLSMQPEGPTSESPSTDMSAFNDHGVASMPIGGNSLNIDANYAFNTDFTNFESFESALGVDQHEDPINCHSLSLSSTSSYPTPPLLANPTPSQPPIWSMSTDMTDGWILSQTPPEEEGLDTIHPTPSFISRTHQRQTKSESELTPPRGSTRAPSSRPPKRQRAHYHIERRYRAGLNEKFDALRDLMETRKRSQSRQLQQEGSVNSPTSGGDSGESGSSVNRDSKMNKAEVLHEAVLCVRELEEENEILMEHFKQLLTRLRAIRSAM